LIGFVEECVSLCQPKEVHVCNGSEAEFQNLCHLLVKQGMFVPLRRPDSFWCHSTADDVARSEGDTYICSQNQSDAGPTNQWKDPSVMKSLLKNLFRGCMQGRTLYVVPFCLGPLGSPYAKYGVQITDSPYVVCNLHLMTRIVTKLQNDFVPCLHSVGYPLPPGTPDLAWPHNGKHRYIVQFPEDPSIWSFGSGYGGNALLSKKCFALRIASQLGRKEGWLAEHMLIIGITNPAGEKKYIAAAFPSSCGKTNLALLESLIPGWKIECVGDDIAWMYVGSDGRLWAINPENGFFGVAPGTSFETNPVAMKMIEKKTLFTNTALTSDHDVWWEGMTKTAPPSLTSWEGVPWTPGKPASHPNARFTVAGRQCSILSPEFDAPQGVPISAILFGGRRASLVPLVFESLSWNHGVFLGASMSSEGTAAVQNATGKLRHDPFAMLPFCGYHMGDYFAHWIKIGTRLRNPPAIFHVNWFRKNQQGDYLWPGFRHNMHVLRWVFERVSQKVEAASSPLGYLPLPGTFEPPELFTVDREGYLKEVEELEGYFKTFGEKFPHELRDELEGLKKRLLARISKDSSQG
jgi:phosphoenolpyruvate carboxykinase (GTP)